jgi:hypothetical protein
MLGIRAHGYAAAHRRIDPLAVYGNAAFRKRYSDALGANVSRLYARSGKYYREFLASDATNYIFWPKRIGGRFAELSDNGIADRMAVCIVDRLKPIKVAHYYRNRRLFTPAQFHNSPRTLREGSSIGDPRQRIDACGRFANRLTTLLDQSQNKDGCAEGKDNVFEMNEAKQAYDRGYFAA